MCYVYGRSSRNALPKKLKQKVSRKTVIRRLGESGFQAKKKISKYDYGSKWRAARLKFARKYVGKSAEGVEE